MKRESLKDGGWVDLRSKEEITTRGRRAIQAIGVGLAPVFASVKGGVTPETEIGELGLSEEQADAMFRLQEATVVAFIAGWSREEPIPTILTVGDLPVEIYDELAELTKSQGAEIVLDTSATTDPTDDAPFLEAPGVAVGAGGDVGSGA